MYRFRDTASYLSKFANFDLPNLHLAPPLGVIPSEFQKDFWPQKTRVPGLSCSVVCMFLCLAILVEHRLVTDTDRQTHGHGIYRESIARAVIKLSNTDLEESICWIFIKHNKTLFLSGLWEELSTVLVPLLYC